MAKVVSLITQVDADGASHLPNEIFEVTDEKKLNELLFNKCVELYQEPKDDSKKKK